MIARILSDAREGLRWLRENPQIWFTLFLALAIAGSYLFVADRFLRVAWQAQEELINVRVGALQDAFAPLAAEILERPDALREHMRGIQSSNHTIVDFSIVRPGENGDWIVHLSTERRSEGSNLLGQGFLLSLARADPRNSFTIEEEEAGERFFRTARAIRSSKGDFLGIAITRQTLSQADRNLESGSRAALLTLVLILLILLLLFFRHARIIDYTMLYRKLREVDALKDEFLSMASHELRAPLTAIRGSAEAAGAAADETERGRWLHMIDVSARELDALIADMLDVSRIEQGRLSIRPVVVQTKPFLEGVLEQWDVAAREKGLALARDLAEDAQVTADPERLRQVVTNLLSNAIKYTRAGTVTVKTSVENGRVAIRVSDSGIGLTEEQRARLFEKFYRAEGEAVRSQPGTGLGLWITRRLVEIMEGSISVESIHGVGSHFIVSFPLARGL